MRTKKIITLVLVLALALSAVSFGASASFSDIEENNANRTYYDLLAGLGIIKGYDDGTFKEANPVTREEAVAFIYRMANGNDNAMKGATAFPDVASDRWSSGYINWAVGKGIVAGYPDGTFKPTNTVTVAEMAKMMVVALGWQTNNYTFPYGFINKAQDLKVLDNINAGNVDQPCTRAMVSVITYNTLFANRVEYNLVNGYPVVNENVPSFIYSGRFNAIEEKDLIVKGTSTLNGAGLSKAGQVIFENNKIISYSGSNANDLIGRKVTVWYQNTDNTMDGNKPTLTENDTILALVPSNDQKVATVKMSAIDATAKTVKIDGFTYDLKNASVTSVTGTIANLDTAGKNVNTLVKVVYTEGTKEVKNVYTYDAVVNQVSRVTSNGTITLKNGGDAPITSSMAKKLYNAYDGIAADDYVYVAQTKAYIADDSKVDTMYIITKADTVSGVEYKENNKDGYVFGADTYKPADSKTITPDLTSSYDLVLSPAGYIVKISATSTTSNKVYGIVTNYGATKTGSMGAGKYTDLTLTVMTSDGVEKTYPVSSKADSSHVYIADNDGGWVKRATNYAQIAYMPVELSLNAEGTVTSIAVATDNAGDYSYNKTTKMLTDGTDSYPVNADSAIFTITWKKGDVVSADNAYDDDATATVTATTGSKLSDFTSKSVLGLQAATSGTKAVKIALFGDEIVASSKNNNGYIQYVRQTTNSAKDIIYTFKATVNGEVVELYTTDKSLATAVQEAAKKTASNKGTAYSAVAGKIVVSGSELKGFDATSFENAEFDKGFVDTIDVANGTVAVKATLETESKDATVLAIKSDVKVYNIKLNGDNVVTEIVADETMPTLENVYDDSEIHYLTYDKAGDDADGMIIAIYIVNR